MDWVQMLYRDGSGHEFQVSSSQRHKRSWTPDWTSWFSVWSFISDGTTREANVDERYQTQEADFHRFQRTNTCDRSDFLSFGQLCGSSRSGRTSSTVVKAVPVGPAASLCLLMHVQFLTFLLLLSVFVAASRSRSPLTKCLCWNRSQDAGFRSSLGFMFFNIYSGVW